jgi:hypothetical protein
MLNLFFANAVTVISTILVLGVLIFSIITIVKQKKINHWGRRVALLFVLGLLVCIFVAIRDNYHLSVMSMTNPNIAPGVFTAESIQSALCCLGGAIIAFCAISSIFIRRQGYLKTMFFILSATIILKTLVIEISRITLL